MAQLDMIVKKHVKDRGALDEMFEDLWRGGRLTINQYRASVGALRSFVGADIVVLQRTPKSVTLIKVNNELKITVSHRAKITISSQI